MKGFAIFQSTNVMAFVYPPWPLNEGRSVDLNLLAVAKKAKKAPPFSYCVTLLLQGQITFFGNKFRDVDLAPSKVVLCLARTLNLFSRSEKEAPRPLFPQTSGRNRKG